MSHDYRAQCSVEFVTGQRDHDREPDTPAELAADERCIRWRQSNTAFSGQPCQLLRARGGGKVKYLLSGLLYCEACGANYVLGDKDKYACAMGALVPTRCASSGMQRKR